MWWTLLVAAQAAPVESVVLLEQGASVCAGTHLGEGRVITAYHCVAGGGPVWVRGPAGERVKARVRQVRRVDDLAMLSAPRLSGLPAVRLAERSPEAGASVTAVGHPYGAQPPGGYMAGTLRWSQASGEVSAVGQVALQTSVPLNPGNSGGPLLNEAGELVGVVSRRLSGQAVGFATKVERVSLLDGAAEHGLSPLGGSVGATLWLSSYGARDGVPSAGAQVELDVRDRVVLSGRAELPLQWRWAAVDRGSASYLPGQGRVALRQRFGTGPWSTTLDVGAGLAGERRISEGEAGLRVQSQLIPIGVATLRVRSIGIEAGYVGLPGDGAWTVAGTIAWPGRVTVW